MLCALLGGVAITGLLNADVSNERKKQREAPVSAQNALPLRLVVAISPLPAVVDLFGSDWSSSLAPSLYSASVFCNLQGLLSSMFALAHVNAMPDAGVGALIRRHSFAIHATGWMLVPAVVSLSAALVCSADVFHGELAAHVTLACAVLAGVLTTVQMVSMHSGAYAIKRALPRLPREAAERHAPWRGRQRGPARLQRW